MQAMANYRQTILTAFQQVEDNLAALRILEQETGATNETVKAAQTALDITVAQYKAGTATYLQVETQQTALFAEQEALVNLLTRRMVSSVLLVEALGGGWDTSQLPEVSALSASDKADQEPIAKKLKTDLVLGRRDLFAVHAVDDQQIAPGVKVAMPLAVFHHGLGLFVGESQPYGDLLRGGLVHIDFGRVFHLREILEQVGRDDVELGSRGLCAAIAHAVNNGLVFVLGEAIDRDLLRLMAADAGAEDQFFAFAVGKIGGSKWRHDSKPPGRCNQLQAQTSFDG